MPSLMDLSIERAAAHGLARLNCPHAAHLTVIDGIALYDRDCYLLSAWQANGLWAERGFVVAHGKARCCVTTRWQVAPDRYVCVVHCYSMTAAGLLQRARAVHFVPRDGSWVLDENQPRILDTGRSVDPMRPLIERMLSL